MVRRMTVRRRPTDSASPQQSLFVNDINEVLKGLISALGGAKIVGERLFPDLPVESAARRVSDAVNDDRRENLSQTQFFTLFRWGREAGYHRAMEWFTGECGYTKPSPLSPEDERAELQRQFIESVKLSDQIAKRLQK